MKKLSLLMFAILILACGNDTPVVEEPMLEEPESVIKEPPLIIEEPSPVVVSGELFRLNIQPPQLVAGSVQDGENNVDPERLNVAGISFAFDENLKLHKIDILHDGKPLPWTGAGRLSERVTDIVTLTVIAGEELQFDTEYVIKIYVQDSVCASSRFEIRFRTMPEP